MTLHTFREGDAGGGLPLVLVHGFPLDHRMWLAAAAALPGEHPVLAVDLPGTPGHDHPLPAPSIDACADDVADALAQAGVARAVVVGMSMGGYVALALAERHPELVAALGLVDTKSTADTPAAHANRLRIADEAEAAGSVAPVRPMSTSLLGETTRSARPALSDQVAAWIEDQSPEGVAWAQRAMAARPDRTDVLRAFDGPVVVVVGDEDDLTPLAAAEHMVASTPQARLVVVPHAGHLAAFEQPDAVAAALADLTQRADTARA
jgi:pimeloyl-ACP methyl ester carboxylesterase